MKNMKHAGFTVFSLWSCNKVVIFIGLTTVLCKEWNPINQIHVRPMESCTYHKWVQEWSQWNFREQDSRSMIKGLQRLNPDVELDYLRWCIMNNLSFTLYILYCKISQQLLCERWKWIKLICLNLEKKTSTERIECPSELSTLHKKWQH